MRPLRIRAPRARNVIVDLLIAAGCDHLFQLADAGLCGIERSGRIFELCLHHGKSNLGYGERIVQRDLQTHGQETNNIRHRNTNSTNQISNVL